jgi:hypothetical protein
MIPWLSGPQPFTIPTTLFWLLDDDDDDDDVMDDLARQ